VWGDFDEILNPGTTLSGIGTLRAKIFSIEVTMGLDGTIKRLDGKPLGTLQEVQRVMQQVFPQIELGTLPSGLEQLRVFEERKIELPEVLRKNFEKMPAIFAGDYQNEDFSAEFRFGSMEIVQHIDVVLRGTTVASEEYLQKLESYHGWITTHP